MKIPRANSSYWDREYHEIVDELGYFPVRCPMTKREALEHKIEFYSQYKAKSQWHKKRIKRKLAQALLKLAQLNSKS